MILSDILDIKGSDVKTISSNATLQEAVDCLVENGIGSLIVCRYSFDQKDESLGIITERDILHACTASHRRLSDVKVADVMTEYLITGSLDDDLEHVMGLMTTRRIRHLPIIADGRLAGMISIGDIVKAQHDRLVLENQMLKNYISG